MGGGGRAIEPHVSGLGGDGGAAWSAIYFGRVNTGNKLSIEAGISRAECSVLFIEAQGSGGHEPSVSPSNPLHQSDYSRTVESSWTVLTVMAALWLIAFASQLADYATARFDHLRLARGVRTRVRLHPVAWVVPLAALALVIGAIGVNLSTRAFFADPTRTSPAVLIALSTVVVLVAVAATVTLVVARPPADSYRLMRDELIELAGVRLHQDQVDEFRARVAAVDAASDDRKRVDGVAASSALTLVVRTPQRFVAPVIALVVAVAALIEVLNDPSRSWVLVVALLTVVVSCTFACVAARASAALRTAVRSTQEVYRGELSGLIAEVEKSSKKRVAGLGDRVARALSILREQQGSQ
ncbi:hypothetical protein ADILRU_0363 [Leifsonia rubra CMS 76R]|nr:hypothetical protein ADILRU_0363 [Leifsonia rubra CMS 76R]